MKSDNLEQRVSAGTKIKNALGDAKLFLNRYLYSGAFLTAVNGAYLWGADQALDYASRRLEGGEGIATATAYLGLTAGLIAVNVGPKIKDKHRGLFYVAKKIYRKNKEDFKEMRKRLKKKPSERDSEREKQKKVLDWFKTGVVGSAMIAAYFLGGFPGVIERFNYDLGRMADGGKSFIQSFARTEEKAPAKSSQIRKQESKPSTEVTLRITTPPHGPFQVPKYLQGKTINGDLYGAYTGVHGVAGVSFNPDFFKQLAQLWDAKIEWMNQRKKKNPIVLEAKNMILKEYLSLAKPTRITLDEYTREADNSINFVNQNLNWAVVAQLKGLNESEIGLVKKISSTIIGKDLITYCLTEIMPSGTDGLKNKLVLDMLLRSAGREYVEFIPAMYDDRTSMGPYQFTMHALYSKDGETNGVSKINLALPDNKRITDSVMSLRGNDHHKAAYMFAINNIAELVGKLNRLERENMWKHYAEHEEDLVQFIATAHHLPSAAIKAAKRWLSNGCKHDFTRSCSSAIVSYAKKTAVNYVAMHANTDFNTNAKIELPPKLEEQLMAQDAGSDSNLHTVTVQKDQTLYGIARQNNVRVEDLKKWNYLKDNIIFLNQKLNIYRNR